MSHTIPHGGRAGRVLAVAVAIALAALAVVPDRSHATFPGANGSIAFERFAGGREDGRTAQIFTRAPDGTVRQLTRFEGGAFDPAWSADGTRIAFERRHERTRKPDELFVMNADGTGARPLTTGCTRAARCLGDDVPAWSPDGRKIVFQRIFGPIVTRRLPVPNRHHDHQTIEQASGADLMVVDSAGGAPTRLRHWGLDPQPWDGPAKFSPDGRSILMPLGTRRQASPSSAIGTALHVLDASGRNERRITPWALGAGNGDWSPDGRRVAFNSEGGHTPFVYTVGADGSGLTQLTKNAAGRDLVGLAPVWSPDGRQIAYARQTPGSRGRQFPPPMDIVVMNADGTSPQAVTSGPGLDELPVWAPGG
jgi:Tol biopolymer transport system component